MTREVVTLSSDISVETAVNDYFLRYGYGGFPVMEAERFLGFLTLKEVKDVPRERWSEVTASGILVPHDKRWQVSGSDDALKALELMISGDQGRLAVIENDRLAGMITRNGIAKYVQIMER